MPWHTAHLGNWTDIKQSLQNMLQSLAFKQILNKFHWLEKRNAWWRTSWQQLRDLPWLIHTARSSFYHKTSCPTIHENGNPEKILTDRVTGGLELRFPIGLKSRVKKWMNSSLDKEKLPQALLPKQYKLSDLNKNAWLEAFTQAGQATVKLHKMKKEIPEHKP